LVFEIVMPRRVLLEKLRKNKERYVKSYKVLLDIFEKESKKYQRAYVEFVGKKLKGTLTDEDEQPYAPRIPEDRTEVYDLYIAMLESHSGPISLKKQGIHSPTDLIDPVTIEIDDGMFAKLYMDRWNWMSSHIHELTIWADSYEDADAMAAMYEAE